MDSYLYDSFSNDSYSIFNGLDIIFWIILIVSIGGILLKGLFWWRLIKEFIGAFLNPFGFQQYHPVSRPVRSAGNNDTHKIILTIIGLIIGVLGLLK